MHKKKCSYDEINSCRLCNSKSLKEFVKFGNIPLGNNLLENRNSSLNAERYPLTVNQCKKCSHFQLNASIDPKKLYATNYTYLSSIGSSFVEHMHNYAAWASKKFSLEKNQFVIDVGSNDGLGLKFFKNLGCNVLGIDPAKYASDMANKSGIKTLNSFFSDEIVEHIIDNYGQADFITSHNVLAHIENLNQVFKNIYRLLKDDGHFVFEIGYFKDVLINGFFDTIYHEHLDYHHANPLVQFLNDVGFEVIFISTNEIQGGSLRIETRKSGRKIISEQVNNFLEKEKLSILYKDDFLNSWKKNIQISMDILRSKIIEYKNKDLSVVGYGAPTKATLLLHLSNLSNKEIDYIYEDNILKNGRYLPFTGIPIISINNIKLTKPKIIVIFAWNFADEIILKLSSIVSWEVKCIVPLPVYKELII